jgi:hypothetical protein
MSTVAVVWFVIALVTLGAVIAVLVGLIRHALVLGRSVKRFQEEVTPLAEQITGEGDRASSRAQRISAERPVGRGGGRAVP